VTGVLRAALAFALLAALALPAVADAGAAPALQPRVGIHGTTAPEVRLSNEWTSTRWAHPVRLAPIRFVPRSDARIVAPLHLRTEDGFPEVYVALRSWRDPQGHSWIQIRIPMRPNGRVGWVRHAALGPLYRVRTLLIVDRPKLRATLYRRGEPVWSAPVGIGKPSTPTPAGRFWIREKFRTPGTGGLYGPVAFGSSDYSVLSDWPGGGVIGLHGTDEPALIPGRPSHGCIRLRNADARALWRRMPVGTPLLIGRTSRFLAHRPAGVSIRSAP
jgi:L,D-transpeptidase catalytic domain